MDLEIERRFLVRTTAWKDQVRTSTCLNQGYITGSINGVTTRVRHDGQGAWLTLKAPMGVKPSTPTSPIQCWEFEYSIPLEDGQCLLEHCSHQVSKERHMLDLIGGDWIVDCFGGANQGLVLAEVELEQPDARFPLPPWLGPEVSGDRRLSNAALAQHPWNQWPQAEKQALWQ